LNDGTELIVKTEEIMGSPTLRKTQSECKKKVYCITPNTNFLKLKITKLADQENEEKGTTPGVKKVKKSKTNVNLESVKIESHQDTTNSKLLAEKDDRSTEASSSMSANQSVKSEDQILLTKSKSCNGSDELIKNNNGKKSGKKDILNGMNLPTEIEDFLNSTNLLNQMQFPAVRKIGTLTVEERRAKIEKYLQKRKKRTWNKKISYDCRKKVADSRLRIKGRFVTKEQAITMLGGDGIYDIDKISSSEIKDLLNLKFGSSITKKKEGTKDETKSKDDSSNEGDKDLKDLLIKYDLKEKENTENAEKKPDDNSNTLALALALALVEKQEIKTENE